MSRSKNEDSKHTRLWFRETLARKRKIQEYAALNCISVSDYIREALDIRDEMTRHKFNLRTESDDIYDYDEDFDYEETDDFDE